VEAERASNWNGRKRERKREQGEERAKRNNGRDKPTAAGAVARSLEET